MMASATAVAIILKSKQESVSFYVIICYIQRQRKMLLQTRWKEKGGNREEEGKGRSREKAGKGRRREGERMTGYCTPFHSLKKEQGEEREDECEV